MGTENTNFSRWNILQVFNKHRPGVFKFRYDVLKVKLTAPPVNNAANRMSIKFLAKALGVPKSSLEIVSGHTSRNKQVLLHSDRTSISEKEYRRLKQLILKSLVKLAEIP